MSRFERWDDKVDKWYGRLRGDSPFLFWILFPFMFVGDLLLVPVRGIIILKRKHKERK